MTIWPAVLLLAAAAVVFPFQATEVARSVKRAWAGPDGEPLPFQNDDELTDFMRTATVVSETSIGQGVNRSQKVLLEKDGVQAHGIFREVDLREPEARVGGRFYWEFRDSYLFEPAAYELAKMLGFDNLPPAVLRQIGRRAGSLQIWIEDALDETAAGSDPPDPSAWVDQIRDIIFFDNLVFNIDRNAGNILVTSDYTLWMIDHTRAFQMQHGLLDPERLTFVNREAWERLRALSDQELRGSLRKYLSVAELNALIERRKRLYANVEELIASRGEDVVFY